MNVLKDLDDRVLGNRMRGDGPSAVLRVVWRVSKIVLFALAAVVVLGVLFTKAPTNAHNVIVRNVLSLARDVAGPFKDVFTPKKAEDALVVNYLVAAGVYLGLGVLIGKLPTGGKK
jgi:hypothetical protein